MEFIRLQSDLFSDEKIRLIGAEKDGDSIVLAWVKLLCLAGQQENLGVFKIAGKAMTADMIATVTGTPKKLMAQAIETFLAYGMITEIDGCYAIENWQKYQRTDCEEARREKDRQRKAEARKRQEMSADEKEKEIDIDKDYIITPPIIPPTDKSADGDRVSVEKSFQGFWNAYPRKEGEEDARKAWRKLKPSPELVEEIMEGLSTWKETEAWEREEGRYIPTAVKFITGKRWKDEPQEFRSIMEWERGQAAFSAKGAMA